jgi:hypothetical protein
LKAPERRRRFALVVHRRGIRRALHRPLVAGGNGDERIRRPVDEHPNERTLELASHRHVEKKERLPDEIAPPARRHDLDRDAKDRGSIGQLHTFELFPVGSEDAADVESLDLVGADISHTELVQRSSERPRKTRAIGDRGEAPEPARPPQAMDDPSADRLERQRPRRRESTRAERLRRKGPREARQREPVPPERAAGLLCRRARDLRGRVARRTHDHHLGSAPLREQKLDATAHARKSGRRTKNQPISLARCGHVIN